MGESAEQDAADDGSAETEDAALDAALRELFLVPAAENAAETAAEPQVELTSWWYRLPGML